MTEVNTRKRVANKTYLHPKDGLKNSFECSVSHTACWNLIAVNMEFCETSANLILNAAEGERFSISCAKSGWEQWIVGYFIGDRIRPWSSWRRIIEMTDESSFTTRVGGGNNIAHSILSVPCPHQLLLQRGSVIFIMLTASFSWSLKILIPMFSLETFLPVKPLPTVDK